jgi:diacylglycerol kinase (ATP)
MIVPAGSGNDFARALNLSNVKDSTAAWRKFEVTQENAKQIDLGTITPVGTSDIRYFCSVAGCGLDAEVARRANALPRWMRGHGGYALSLPAAILSYQARIMKLSTADDRNETYTVRRDTPALLIAFANAPAYGDGMKIAPRAKLDDGQLDVCCIDQIPKAKLLRLFPTVYFGKHLGISEVEYFQARRLRLVTDCSLDVYADGEYVCETPVEVGLAPAALRVIVP